MVKLNYLRYGLLLLTIAFSGCGHQRIPSNEVKLTYTYWGAAEADESRKKAIQKFNDVNKGRINVECVHVPEDYDTKIYTMMAQGKAPDVGIVDTSTSWAKLSEKGELLDLNTYIKNDSEFSLSGFIEGLEFYWEDNLTAIGNEPQVFLMYYNKTLFDKYGVDYPSHDSENPWTWDKTIEVSKLLTVDNKGNNAFSPDFDSENIVQYGIQIPKWFAPLQSVIMSNGGDFLTNDGQSFGLSEEKSVEALQMISDLTYVHHVTPSLADAYALGSTSAAMANGKIAMLIDGHWCNNILASTNVDYDVASIPSFGEASVKTWFGTSGISIFSDSKHPDEAWELVKFLLTEGGNEQVVLDGVSLPILTEWYTDEDKYDYWTTYEPYHSPNYKTLIKDYVLYHSVPSVTLRIKNFEKYDEAVTIALDSVWSGKTSVSEAFRSNEQAIDEQIKGWTSNKNEN